MITRRRRIDDADARERTYRLRMLFNRYPASRYLSPALPSLTLGRTSRVLAWRMSRTHPMYAECEETNH
jgi:hypothetical protein